MAVKKYRKKRQMTEEQKKAASDRLAKARAKRFKKNPPKYSNIHPSVVAKPDNDPLSRVNVMRWIKTQKELLSEAKRLVRQKVKGAEMKVAWHEGYIRNCEAYLRNGDWVDDFYGEHQQNKIKWRCIAMAYDTDGNPKRTKGTYYPDLGTVWE